MARTRLLRKELPLWFRRLLRRMGRAVERDVYDSEFLQESFEEDLSDELGNNTTAVLFSLMEIARAFLQERQGAKALQVLDNLRDFIAAVEPKNSAWLHPATQSDIGLGHKFGYLVAGQMSSTKKNSLAAVK